MDGVGVSHASSVASSTPKLGSLDVTCVVSNDWLDLHA